MKNKKILWAVIIVVVIIAVVAGVVVFKKTQKPEAVTDVALVTDVGTIDDESFNQACWQGVEAYAKANNLKYQYYQPAADSTDERLASIDQAVKDGARAIVMPGFLFGEAAATAQSTYPDVKFIAIDVSAGDLNTDALENLYCAVFGEEQAGYVAGYAAVKDGFTKLGFLGGMAVPAVQRYGYGFVQGANAAAVELGTPIEIKYTYGGQFFGDANITAKMEGWYAEGTEIVFACGGGIFTSAAEAAKKVNAKVIGVDVDQAAIIDGGYGEGMTVTSAMKGLAPATIDTLTDIINNGNWSKYVGQIATLGLVTGDDPTLNYVQIPMETTQWEDGKFTQDDYKALVKDMFDGKITVSNDISVEPTVTNVAVDYQGQIKG